MSTVMKTNNTTAGETAKKARIYKSCSCYNPFYFEGKQIHAIIFYKDGRALASTKWFGGNNAYNYIDFDFEIKRALSVNLSRKDAFYTLSKEATFGKEYDLYIYADLVNLRDLGRSEGYKAWYSTSTKQTFSVELTGEKEIYTKIAPDDWKYIPQRDTFIEKFDCNYIHTETEEAKKCKALAEKINKVTNIKLTDSDIHYILEKFDIIEK